MITPLSGTMDVLEFKANPEYTDLFSGPTPEGLLAGVPGLFKNIFKYYLVKKR